MRVPEGLIFHVYRCGHLCSWKVDSRRTLVRYASLLDCCRCADGTQMDMPHSHCLSLSGKLNG